MRIVNVATVAKPISAHIKSDSDKQHASEYDVAPSNGSKDSGTKTIIDLFERSPLRNGSPSIASMIQSTAGKEVHSLDKTQRIKYKHNHQQTYNHTTQMHFSPKTPVVSNVTSSTVGSDHLTESPASERSSEAQSTFSRDNTFIESKMNPTVDDNSTKDIMGKAGQHTKVTALRNSTYNPRSLTPATDKRSPTEPSSNIGEETKKKTTVVTKNDDEIPRKPSAYKVSPSLTASAQNLVQIISGVPSLQSPIDAKASMNQDSAPTTDLDRASQYPSKVKSSENSFMQSTSKGSSSEGKVMGGINSAPIRTSWKKSDDLIQGPSVMVKSDSGSNDETSKKPPSFKAITALPASAPHRDKEDVSSLEGPSLSIDSKNASKNLSNNFRENGNKQKTIVSSALGEKGLGSMSGPMRTNWNGPLPKQESDMNETPKNRSSKVTPSHVDTVQQPSNKVAVNIGIPSLSNEPQTYPKGSMNEERAPANNSYKASQIPGKLKSNDDSSRSFKVDSSSSDGKAVVANAVPIRTNWKKSDTHPRSVESLPMVERDIASTEESPKKPSSYKASRTFSTSDHHPNKVDASSGKVPSLSTDSDKPSQNLSKWKLRESSITKPTTNSSSLNEKAVSPMSDPIRTSWKKFGSPLPSVETPSITCIEESKFNETHKNPSSFKVSPSHADTVQQSNKMTDCKKATQYYSKLKPSESTLAQSTVDSSSSVSMIVGEKSDGRLQTVESPSSMASRDSESHETPKKPSSFKGSGSFTTSTHHQGKVNVSLGIPSLTNVKKNDTKVRIDDDSVSTTLSDKASPFASPLSGRFNSKEIGFSDVTIVSSADSKPFPVRTSLKKSYSQAQTVDSPSLQLNKENESNEIPKTPSSYKVSPKIAAATQQPDKVDDSLNLLFPSLTHNEKQVEPEASFNNPTSPSTIPMHTSLNKTDGQMQSGESPIVIVTERGSEFHEASEEYLYVGSPSVTSAAEYPDKVAVSIGFPTLSPDSNNMSQNSDNVQSTENGFDISSHYPQNTNTSLMFFGDSTLPVESSVRDFVPLENSEILIKQFQETKDNEKYINVVTPESVDGKSPSISMSSAAGDDNVYFPGNFDEDPLLHRSEFIDTSSIQGNVSEPGQPESAASDVNVHFEVNFDEDPLVHHSESKSMFSRLGNVSEPEQPESIEKTDHYRIASALTATNTDSNQLNNCMNCLSRVDDIVMTPETSNVSAALIESDPVLKPSKHSFSDETRQHLLELSGNRQEDNAMSERMTAISPSGNSGEVEDRSSSPSRCSVRSKVSKFEGVSKLSSTGTPNRNNSDHFSSTMQRSPARVPFNIPNLHLDLASSSWRDFRLHLMQLADRPEWIMPALTRFHPENGASPLHTAVWKAPTILTLMLVQLLSSADETLDVFSSKDRDGNTALHLMCANLQVSKDNMTELDLSAFEELLKHSSHLCQLQNNQGDSPLHLLVNSAAARSAIPSVQEEIYRAVQLLLDSSSEKVGLLRIRDQLGATPLHTAISSGAHQSIILRVLDLEPNVALMEDERGLIPLHYAAALSRSISPSVVKALIQAYQMGIYHKAAQSGDIPIHIAISNFSNLSDSSAGNSEKAIEEIFSHLMGSTFPLSERIIDELESTILTTNIDKSTPLHTCALFDAPTHVIKLLMSHPTAMKALPLQNCFGATALHLTCAQPSVASSIERAVLLGSKEAASVQDKLGRTALHVSAQNIHSTEELISFLVRLHPESLQMKMQSGSVPLQLAVKTKANLSVVIALHSSNSSFINITNKSGNTLLHDAVAHQASLDVVQYLMDENPKAISAKNNFGNIPLHCAVLGQARSEVIEYLLKCWPDGACVQNRKLESALHLAVDTKSMESIMLFLDYSPSALLILNEKGKSPLETAKEANLSDELIKIMLDRSEEWSRTAFDNSWVKF